MKSYERKKWLKIPRGEFKSQPAGGRQMSLIPVTFCSHQRLKQSPSVGRIISWVISWGLATRAGNQLPLESRAVGSEFFKKAVSCGLFVHLYPGISACTSAILRNRPQMLVFKITPTIPHTYWLIGCNSGNERGQRLHAPFSKHSRNGLKASTTTAVVRMGDCLCRLTRSIFRKQTQCWVYLHVFFHFLLLFTPEVCCFSLISCNSATLPFKKG